MQLPITNTLVLKARLIRSRSELSSNVRVIITLIWAPNEFDIKVCVAVRVVLGTEFVGGGNVKELSLAACAEVGAFGDEVGGGAPVEAVGPGVDFGVVGGDPGDYVRGGWWW